MSATNTPYGVLTIGTDPGNWVFCENKYNNYFIEISKEDFERGIETWKPISPDALAINSQGNQPTTHQWKWIALTLGILLVTTYLSLFYYGRIYQNRDRIYQTKLSISHAQERSITSAVAGI